MTLIPVTPLKAQGLLGAGARLVDIRSPHEFTAGHAAGAENRPLGSGDEFHQSETIIFLCRTGKRAEMNEVELSALCSTTAYRIEGGLEAWRDAGLPISSEAESIVRLEGQAMVIAGSLILVALLLGWTRSAWFLMLPALLALDMIRAGLGASSLLARAVRVIGGRIGKTRQEH